MDSVFPAPDSPVIIMDCDWFKRCICMSASFPNKKIHLTNSDFDRKKKKIYTNQSNKDGVKVFLQFHGDMY